MKFKLVLGILVLLSLLFYRGWFIRVLESSRVAIEALVNRIDCGVELETIKAENLALRTRLQAGLAPLDFENLTGLAANVHSNYPFTGRGVLIVDKGENDGVRAGMPVLTADGVLAGKIGKVKKFQSEAILITDSSWRSSVRIRGEIPALLQGSSPPKLEFIPQDAEVSDGDGVINVSADFPFGIAVGEVTFYESAAQETWARARVELPYNPEHLLKVFIITDFP